MLPASFALPAAVVRPRTTVARRALQVLLLLGGFLTLAFVLGGQAHADTREMQVSPTTASLQSAEASWKPMARPTTTVEHATGAIASRTQAVGESLTATVSQVSGATDTTRPLKTILGTVQGATQQVASPLIGATTGKLLPGHPAASTPTAVRHTAVRPSSPVRAALSLRIGRTAAAAHGTAKHTMRAAHTKQQAPGSQLPAPAGHSSDHPVEGDGGSHHTGDAHAAMFPGGVRIPLSAAVIGSAHDSSPQKRSTSVSVQPD